MQQQREALSGAVVDWTTVLAAAEAAFSLFRPVLHRRHPRSAAPSSTGIGES